MAPKKKIVEEVKEVVQEEVVSEDPVVIAGVAAESEESEVPEIVPVVFTIDDVPLADLKELLNLLKDSYSRSNNRSFRLQAKRLEAAVGEFVAHVELARKHG